MFCFLSSAKINNIYDVRGKIDDLIFCLKKLIELVEWAKYSVCVALWKNTSVLLSCCILSYYMSIFVCFYSCNYKICSSK